MSGTSEDYQDALATLEAAQNDARRLIRKIRDIADALRTQERFVEAIGWKYGITDIPGRRGPRLDPKETSTLDNWPSGDELEKCIRAWHAAWAHAHEAYKAAEKKHGLMPPPESLSLK